MGPKVWEAWEQDHRWRDWEWDQRWGIWEQDHRGTGPQVGGLGMGPNVRGLGMGLKILAATIFDSSADGVQSYDPVNRVVTWNVRIIYLHVYLCPILGLQPASSWAGPGNEAAV